MANVKTTAVRTRPANDPSPITLSNQPLAIDLGAKAGTRISKVGEPKPFNR